MIVHVYYNQLCSNPRSHKSLLFAANCGACRGSNLEKSAHDIFLRLGNLYCDPFCYNYVAICRDLSRQQLSNELLPAKEAVLVGGVGDVGWQRGREDHHVPAAVLLLPGIRIIKFTHCLQAHNIRKIILNIQSYISRLSRENACIIVGSSGSLVHFNQLNEQSKYNRS